MQSPSFEAIAYQFCQRRIVITRLPAEYSVNYLAYKADTAEFRETLNEAIELAQAMAQSAGERLNHAPLRLTRPEDKSNCLG
jgi:hypothetical protein